MSITVNGESQVPPGFRFHPTEEELLQYYLKKKVCSHKIDLDVIQDVDLNKLEPWDIQDKCKIGSSTPQSDWYFFSHKDKKYPTGTRTNRATLSGFWKATGRDKAIYGGPNSSSSSSRRIGMRKTLVFYMGRAPHGQKSDWIMHEYRLDDNPTTTTTITTTTTSVVAEMSNNIEEGWVVCRVFMKKNHQHKTILLGDQHQNCGVDNNDPPMMITPTNYNYNYNWAALIDSCVHDDDVVDQDQYDDQDKRRRSFLKLPSLHQHDDVHRNIDTISLDNSSISSTTCADADHDLHDRSSGIQDWAALDRWLAASHLNGQQTYNSNYNYTTKSSKQVVLNNNGHDDHRLPSPSSSSTTMMMFQNGEYSCDLWSIARSSSNDHHQLCHNVPE